MQITTLLAAGALALTIPGDGAPLELAIPYKAGLGLQMSVESEYTSETTAFTMTRDGEETDMTDRMGGPSVTTRTIVIADRYSEVEDGKPMAAMRFFETLGEASERSMRGEMVESERSTPLEGVTLALTIEDGDVTAEVEDGDSPDDDSLLEGLTMTLGLEGLLPLDEVEAGASWSVEGAGLMAALGYDVEAQLFPAPVREEGEGGPRGRGGPRGGAGGGPGEMMRGADWDLEATLGDEPKEVDGVSCLVIELKGDGTYELPERTFGGGGGPGGRALVLEPTPLLGGTANIEVEGTLLLNSETHMPISLSLEVGAHIEQLTERSSERGDMSMQSTVEGTLLYEASFEVLAAKDTDE